MFTYVENDTNGGFFSLEHEGELIFEYQSGTFNFKTQEATDVAEELTLKIERRCESTYRHFWTGVFAVAEGFFDEDKCQYTVKPRRREYLLDDVSVNLLEAKKVGTDEGVIPQTSGIFTGTGPSLRNYTQAIAFDDGLLFVAQKSNSAIQGIISDFFQINPVVVSGNCLPGITNTYTAMVFVSISDLQEPIPSDLATKEFITFRELLADLHVLFDVFWYIDDNYHLRIEHRTYFTGVLGYNLTTASMKKYQVGKNKYKYHMPDYPRSEVWRFGLSPQYAKHKYSDLGMVKTNKKEETYRTNKLNTDVARVRFLGANSQTDGFFLIATNGLSPGNFEMLETNGQNHFLTPEYLVKNIHSYNRPYLYSYFESMNITQNGSDFHYGGYLANDIRPSKLQEDIVFPLCCDTDFDIKQQIKTDLGTGYVTAAKLDQKSSNITVSLKYKVSNEILFSPDQLDPLSVWLKRGEGVTLTGGVVSQWDDASGNGRHAVQFTAGNRPTYNGTTGKISFAVGKFLQIGAFQLFPAKRGTIFVVFDTTSFVASQRAVLSNNNAPNPGPLFDFTIVGQNMEYLAESALVTPAHVFYTPNIFPLTASHIHGLWQLTRIDDTHFETHHNGVKGFPFLFNPFLVSNSQVAFNPLVIGDSPVNPGFGAGILNVSEVIIYDRVLTDVERQKVEFYLIKKQTFGIYP